jgi:hypothetical protein
LYRYTEVFLVGAEHVVHEYQQVYADKLDKCADSAQGTAATAAFSPCGAYAVEKGGKDPTTVGGLYTGGVYVAYSCMTHSLQAPGFNR